MKLSPRDANTYFKRPDTSAAGCLIFGDDAMRVALKRQEFLKALLAYQRRERRFGGLPNDEDVFTPPEDQHGQA